MTYLYVCLAVVAVAVAISAIALSRVSPSRRRPTLLTSLAALLVVGALTAVFDSLMIAAGLFTYAEEHLVGWRIGLAPIEDFSYVLVVALMLPALWALLRTRHSGEADLDHAGEGPPRPLTEGASR